MDGEAMGYCWSNAPNRNSNGPEAEAYILDDELKQNIKLDSTRRKASEICLRPPLDIYSHTFSR